LTASRKNGTIIKTKSKIKRKLTRKTNAKSNLSSRLKMSKNKSKQKKKRLKSWKKSTIKSTRLATSFMIPFELITTKITMKLLEPGVKFLTLKSPTREEVLITTKFWNHWEVMTQKEDRKLQAIEATSLKDLEFF
jgi:hypothetical protein